MGRWTLASRQEELRAGEEKAMYFNEEEIKYYGVDYEEDEREYWRVNEEYQEEE